MMRDLIGIVCESRLMQVLLLVVVLCFVLMGYGCYRHESGIHAGRIVEHRHKEWSFTPRYDPALEIVVAQYEPEEWWVVIEAHGQRNRFDMDRYDWEAVKIGDYVRFEGDKFCGVENAEKAE